MSRQRAEGDQQRLSPDAVADVESLRTGLLAVAAGEREVRIAARGDDELGELATTANEMVDRLVEAETSCGRAWASHRRLLAAVSHDLRTPLSALAAMAEAIGDADLDETVRIDYARRLSGQVRTLGTMVEDLFELSRIQAGDSVWAMEPVRLEELIEETVEAIRPEASGKRVAMHIDVPAGLPPARANPGKVQRVLVNLLHNALRHTPPEGEIRVAAVAVARRIETEVADTGEGIDRAARAQLFEPFAPGNVSDLAAPGRAGLGLSICRAIIEAHGGRVWLADSTRGTRVRFELPLALETV